MTDAIWRDDVDAVRDLIDTHPQTLHEDARGVDGSFTHWGVEVTLRHAGFVPERIEAGPSAFLVMLHHLVDLAGPRLAVPIAKITVRPFVWFLRVFGKAFIFFRYGRTSWQMRKIDAYFTKFTLRFAGHLQFVGTKPGPGVASDPTEPQRNLGAPEVRRRDPGAC